MFGLDLGYVKKFITATDLDHDGLAEIWSMYHLTCTSDVSPQQMKIIMYEGDQKYALRGEELLTVQYDDSQSREGGDGQLDKAFKNGPEAFRIFAATLWQKHRVLR